MKKLNRAYSTGMVLLPVAAAGFGAFFGTSDPQMPFTVSADMAAWIPQFSITEFWVCLCALLAIVNPVAGIPLFLSFTAQSSPQERRKLALQTAIAVLIAGLVAVVFGKALLSFFALSVDSLRVAGGIIVMMMGIQLLHSELVAFAASGEASTGADERSSKMVCPLAIPFLLGPGAITTIIVHCETNATFWGQLMVASAVLVVAMTVFVVLTAAQTLARRLGDSGLTVVARIGGMIIAAIAIDMMITGIRNSFPGIA